MKLVIKNVIVLLDDEYEECARVEESHNHTVVDEPIDAFTIHDAIEAADGEDERYIDTIRDTARLLLSQAKEAGKC